MKAQYQNFVGLNLKFKIPTLVDLKERAHAQFLRDVVNEFYPQKFDLKVLDMTVGSDVAGDTLRDMGFDVSIAISGIMNLKQMNQKFDLVHDGDCLTNLPLSQDRARFLVKVQNSLAVDGKFVLKTEVMFGDYNPTESFESVLLTEDFILWRQTPACDLPEVVEMNGLHWTAQKRIVPPATLRTELVAAGFEILSETLEVPGGNAPAIMKLVLASAKGR